MGRLRYIPQPLAVGLMILMWLMGFITGALLL